MQDTSRTLTDADIDAMEAILLSGAQEQIRRNAAPVEQTMTLTKADLADLLFEKVGLNKREAKDMVESFFEEVRMALEAGRA